MLVVGFAACGWPQAPVLCGAVRCGVCGVVMRPAVKINITPDVEGLCAKVRALAHP